MADDPIKRARARFDRARTDLEAAIVDALKRRERPTDVAKRSRYTYTTIRNIARDNGIPPDERYVRTPKAAATAPNDDHLEIDDLPRTVVVRLAAQLEEAEPANWVQAVTAGASKDRAPYVLVKAGLAERRLSESQIPH
jgi:hypothetical protein